MLPIRKCSSSSNSGISTQSEVKSPDRAIEPSLNSRQRVSLVATIRSMVRPSRKSLVFWDWAYTLVRRVPYRPRVPV